MGWGPAVASDDRYLVAAGTLSLLAAAAKRLPFVDDLHWLDPGSASAVLFAARRLAHDAVAILLATRHGAPAGTTLDGLDTIELRGLSASDAALVVPPGTDRAVVWPTRCSDSRQPAGPDRSRRAPHTSPAPWRRPVASTSCPREPGSRPCLRPVIAALPPGARHAVLLAAAAHDETAEPLIGALRAQHIDPELALGEAERRRVLVREPGLVRFRHPLLRTAAWAAATSAEQRAAHAALAAAMPKARQRTRVWHLAAAATEADSALADELERLADEDRDRFGHATAWRHWNELPTSPSIRRQAPDAWPRRSRTPQWPVTSCDRNFAEQLLAGTPSRRCVGECSLPSACSNVRRARSLGPRSSSPKPLRRPKGSCE